MREPHHKRPPRTLRLRTLEHLAKNVQCPLDPLLHVAENVEPYYHEFDREVKGKMRRLVYARRPLKGIQYRILKNLLLRIPVTPHSFGSVKGRSIKDNARIHAQAPFMVKLDIRRFYPSIHSSRVYDFFVDDQECVPDVARVLTKLCTRKHCIPLGVSTSPLLADLIVRNIDTRIAGLAAKHHINYSRYVDDITLSGHFPLKRIASLVIKILTQHGFRSNQTKMVFYGPDDIDREITGVALHKGRLTAPRDYVQRLEAELGEAIQNNNAQIAPRFFAPREHYLGQIGYVRWLDQREGYRLIRLYRRVKWKHIEWLVQTGAVGGPGFSE